MFSLTMLCPPFLAAAGHGELIMEWHFSPEELGWRSLAVLFFVFLNAFFVAAEFAIVKVRSSQLEAAISEGKSGAVRAWNHSLDSLRRHLKVLSQITRTRWARHNHL